MNVGGDAGGGRLTLYMGLPEPRASSRFLSVKEAAGYDGAGRIAVTREAAPCTLCV